MREARVVTRTSASLGDLAAWLEDGLRETPATAQVVEASIHPIGRSFLATLAWVSRFEPTGDIVIEAETATLRASGGVPS